MLKASSLIRYDREFSQSITAAREALSAAKPLPIVINGLSGGAADAYVFEAISDLRESGYSTALVLAPTDSECARIARYLSLSGINAMHYKPRDFVFYNVSASCDIDRERLSVLISVLNSECAAVVSTPAAAALYTMPIEVLSASALSIRVGDEISLDSVRKKLSSLGFASVDMVESVGQFSVRGGILDVWHEAASHPIRVEFFGDFVDRMVYFDPDTQRSEDNCPEICLFPSREVIISPEREGKILSEIDKLIKKCTDGEDADRLRLEREMLSSTHDIPSRDKYFGLIYEQRDSLFSYLSAASARYPVFVMGTSAVRENFSLRAEGLNSVRAELLEKKLTSVQAAHYMAPLSFFNDTLDSNLTLHINSFAGGVGNLKTSGLFGFRARTTPAYGQNPSLLVEDIKAFRRGGYRTVIMAETKGGAESLISALAGEEIAAVPIYSSAEFDFSRTEGGSVLVDVGACDGFELITPKIAVLSMAVPEGRIAMQNRRRKRIIRRAGGAGERLMSYADLSVGDYVVHANYGIGLFEGIEAVTVDGVTRDYITIRYAGTDKLFVPCDRLELIGKYIGERDDNGKVKLSKMGGGDWTRAKTRAKSAAKNIAKDLIRIYAERQRLPGFAFPADSELEDSFAAEFEYEETESQLIAIEEIKNDMMKPVPMNRLLCGDVGFGKTEVALRAAFKAIVAGKQVALLVPTTILALQHYQTALSRMRSYPVTVEMICRFKTPKEQEKILRKTARGEVDLLIGTHKLLSNKVSFKDLGLLIIDEEQRFGVSQKEKLKEMARCVDTLTLSATPIPRTLNMAMNGISDMSILDEAPGERRPVQTYVLEYDDGVINDAIQKELARGGQVLYLYNKIDDIDLVATRLIRAFPDARVSVAHGAMERDELEDIWQGLVRREVDVLVCTTIIETGVDLPGANTLIIENADRMGLSQLHQIRGRVGRSERQAYAYFTFRRGKALSEIAQKRLNAIREFATFGAGFKVALRDLEIRGAGNLLGAEQHGYIESVGYDLYVRLLSEAVLEESGRTPEPEFESKVDIRASAYISEAYISVNSHRMEMYKKISLIRVPEDAEDIIDEFTDRFGDIPRETETLIKISLIRALASKARIRKVESSQGVLSFVTEKPELSIWSELFGKWEGLTFRPSAGAPTVAYRLKRGESDVGKAVQILTDYVSVLNEPRGK